MSFLLTSTADVCIILALGLAAAALLRRRSAAWRHWTLATAIVCAVSMPALELVLPAWDLPLPAWGSSVVVSPIVLTSHQPAAASGARSEPPAAAAGRFMTRLATRRDTAVVTVWLAGVVMGLGVLLTGLWRLARLGRGARVVREGSWSRIAAEAAQWHGLRRPVLLLHSGHPTLVVTWGVRRPRVLLPDGAHEWSEDRMRVVLFHELAHVRRGDWSLLIAASVLRCLYWFNPLVWIAERRLRHESEHACDDAVLEAGVDGADYAAHLLAVANDMVRLRHRWTPAAAIAYPSTLEERVRAMLNTRLNRDPLTRLARAVTTLALIAATTSIAGAGVSAGTGSQSAGRNVALTTTAIETPVAAPLGPVTTLTASVAAQAGPGAIAGTLYDQMGGLLPGVEVSLEHKATRGTYGAITDATGSFEFTSLPTGQYTIETRLPGFAPVQAVVEVTQGDLVHRSLTLPLGSIEETITVTAEGAGAAPRVRALRLPAGRGDRPPVSPGGQGAAPFSGGIGGQIAAPRKLVDVNPVYPESLEGTGVDGHVVLAARIGIDGYTVDVRHVENATTAPPHPELVDAAIAAVQQWVFSPTRLNGVPVETNMSVYVRFEVRSN